MKRLLHLALNDRVAHHLLSNFHTFQCNILLQYPNVTPIRRQLNKRKRGNSLKCEKRPLAAVIPVTKPSQYYCHCTPRHHGYDPETLLCCVVMPHWPFCTTAFLQKVVKMLKGSCGQITKLHRSPPRGTTIWNQSKVLE